jgi:hypothetical protein
VEHVDSIIFGVDISKGSPKARTPPHYALVILQNNQTEKLRMLTKHKLLQLIQQHKPDILATDNIYELAPQRKELLKLLQQIPPSTKVVQITGRDHTDTLPRIAQRYGITFNRFDPVDEAHACALLAQKGVGYLLEAFENATRITITRARSPGRGGWSQNRYRRKIHGAVRTKTRDIEAYLKEYAKTHNTSYTLKVVRGYGGYTRGEFIVQAPRDKLHIQSERTENVQVEVKSIEKDSIKLTPLHKPKHPYIIAGIDPGTTTALAVLNLEGQLLHLGSSRTTSISATIETLSHLGRPLIIATDVNPTPHSVERIRRSFNAVSCTPPESLSIEEKIELTQHMEYANTHERDALAAALYAYRKYKNKFQQIERKTLKNADAEEIKAKVVRGAPIDSTPEPAKTETTPTPRKTETPSIKKETVRKQQEQIKILKEYINELQKQITSKDLEIRALQNKIRTLQTKEHEKLKRDKEIRIRNKKIRQLKTEIQRKDSKIRQLKELNHKINQMRKLEITGHATPVKVVESFTRDSIKQTQENYGIKKGDLLLIINASGGGAATADLLAQLQVKAVITCSDMSHAAEQRLFTHNIPVFSTTQLQVKREDDFAIVNTEELHRAIAEWEKKAEKERYKQKQQWLQQLIQEYQSERRKQLKKQQEQYNGVENR